jgi:UDP-N-acetylmuramoylalanine--D-glutamate ligase
MLTGKNIAIFGLGKEGISAANFLGKNNNITLFDDKNEDEINKSRLKKLHINCPVYYSEKLPNEAFDLVVRSPGVKITNPKLQRLIEKGAKLTSPTKIFFELCNTKIIGVTGTKGKGTTSTLIYEILKTTFPDVFLAGNIGLPALDVLPSLKKESIVVLEMSSFQLIDLGISPHIAVVLMITSEHLDWHKDNYEYVSAKENIIKHQTKGDFAVINYNSQTSRNFAKKTKAKTLFFSKVSKTNGVYVENGQLVSNINRKEVICPIKEILLPGTHNLENVAAAVTVAKIQHIENKNIIKILRTFKGLKHRLQLVRIVKDVSFYNDSFATTPETAVAALHAFTKPKILILGGSSKNSDFKPLASELVRDKTLKAIILIGREAKKIKEEIVRAGGFKNIIEGPKNMTEIVYAASQLAGAGDIVLLSPSCASFDMFKNYQDRGDQFIKEVTKL